MNQGGVVYNDEYITKLREERARIFHQMKEIADREQAGEARAEDEASWQSANADYDRVSAKIERAEQGNAHQEIEERYTEARVVARPQFLADAAPAAPAEDDATILRRLVTGEIRAYDFGPERRDVLKGNTGAPVPTSFYNQLIEHLIVLSPMLDASVVQVLNTAGGENLQIPRTSAYSAGTVFAEGSAIGESDPAFQAFLTLGAYKFGAVTQISSEMITDSGVDIIGFLARQLATGIGTAVGGKLTNGTGTVEPRGIFTQAGTGVTGGTGTLGFPSADNLIDLSFSLNSSYRRQPGVGWMCSASALAGIRKLKTTDNAYIYEPSLKVGTVDLLLGKPVYENPDASTPAINTNSVLFGDLRSFYVRQVGGINLARSDEYAFVNDLVTFRATWRGDSGLPQQAALKLFRGGTAV
jgi:HK97 family phage major capsid protein